MAKKYNIFKNANSGLTFSASGNTGIATLNPTNTLQITNNGVTKTLVDDNFTVHSNKLVLEDEDTGREWSVKIKSGKLIVEPLDPIDKRNFKIDKVIGEE